MPRRLVVLLLALWVAGGDPRKEKSGVRLVIEVGGQEGEFVEFEREVAMAIDAALAKDKRNATVHGSHIDAWLMSQLTWAVEEENDEVVVLRRFPRNDALRDLLMAVERIQYQGGDRARVAFINDGFFGNSMHYLAVDFSRNVVYGDAPVIPVTSRHWPYVDGTCPTAQTNHRSLECYFLPATSQRDFDPRGLWIRKHNAAPADVPIGSGSLCGHRSLVVVRGCSEKNLTRRTRPHKHNNTTSVKNLTWHVQCDPVHRDGKDGNQSDELLALYAAVGDDRDLDWHSSSSSKDRLFRGFPDAMSKSMVRLAMLVLVALRPNRRTRIEVAQRVDHWKREHPGWSQGGPCAAIHVRHGDKVTPHWQQKKEADRGFASVTLQDYLNASRRGTILLMTDDKDVLDEAQPGRVFSVPTGRPLVSSSKVARDPRSGNHQVDCTKDLHRRSQLRQQRHQRESKRAPPSCAHDYLRHPKTGQPVGSEELLQWLVTWDLMADCDTFVAYSIKASFFTEFIFVWLCIQRWHHGHPCPRLVLLSNDHL